MPSDIILSAMDSYPTDPDWDLRADLTGDLYIDSWDLALVLTYMDEQGSAPVIVQLTPNPSAIYPGDNFTLAVEVLEGHGMRSQSMNQNTSIETSISPLSEVIQNWLMEKLGDDYDTFDPDNPPAYLSAPDARTATFLWYLLHSEQ